MFTPCLYNDSVSVTANLFKLSPEHFSKRPIMTWGSVKEEEVIKAFENFLSTIENKNLSTREKCSLYIKRLIELGNLLDAIRLFSYLQDRQIHIGTDINNILLNAAGEANSFDLFTEIFKKLLLSRHPPDFTSYVHVAKAFRYVSDSILLLKFIRELLEITISREPIVMNRIIYITAKSGQLDKSLMIFEELKNSKAKIDTVTFNTVLVILGRAGRVDEMLKEFSIMKELGHSPNLVTYNTLINCLRRLGRLDICKSFAKEMVEKGIELDLRTYTALIDGFGRAGHLNDAMRLFDEMKRSQIPSVYVYRAMISNLKKAGRFELALNLSEEMNSSSMKLIGPEDFKRKKKAIYYSKVRLEGS